MTIDDSSDNDWSDDEDVPVIVNHHFPGDVESVGTVFFRRGGGEDLENSAVSGQSTSSSQSETEEEDNV